MVALWTMLTSAQPWLTIFPLQEMVGGLSGKDLTQHFYNENQTETKPFDCVVKIEEAGMWSLVDDHHWLV
jgi:hypothetical protein